MDASERAASTNAHAVRRAIKALGVVRLDDLTPGAIQGYLTGLHEAGLSAQTIHHHRNAIRRFCAYLVQQGALDRNPAGRDLLRLPRVRRRPPRYLTDGQVRDLLRALKGTEYHAPVLLALETGLRLGELRALRWEDVGKGQITVHGKVTRGENWRVVPVTAKALRALGKRGHGPVFRRRRADNWCKALARLTAELPVFGQRERGVGNAWHLLRSSWAVNQARKDVGLWKLMALGGWRSPQTVMRYIDIARAAGMVKG